VEGVTGPTTRGLPDRSTGDDTEELHDRARPIPWVRRRGRAPGRGDRAWMKWICWPSITVRKWSKRFSRASSARQVVPVAPVVDQLAQVVDRDAVLQPVPPIRSGRRVCSRRWWRSIRTESSTRISEGLDGGAHRVTVPSGAVRLVSVGHATPPRIRPGLMTWAAVPVQGRTRIRRRRGPTGEGPGTPRAPAAPRRRSTASPPVTAVHCMVTSTGLRVAAGLDGGGVDEVDQGRELVGPRPPAGRSRHRSGRPARAAASLCPPMCTGMLPATGWGRRKQSVKLAVRPSKLACSSAHKSPHGPRWTPPSAWPGR